MRHHTYTSTPLVTLPLVQMHSRDRLDTRTNNDTRAALQTTWRTHDTLIMHHRYEVTLRQPYRPWGRSHRSKVTQLEYTSPVNTTKKCYIGFCTQRRTIMDSKIKIKIKISASEFGKVRRVPQQKPVRVIDRGHVSVSVCRCSTTCQPSS